MNDSFQLSDRIKKAEAGDVRAMRRVAFHLLYEYNMDDLETETLAMCLRYLHRAIAAGNPDAMMDLGGMYLTGRGVAMSRDMALYWYGKATEWNHPLAFNRIAQVYLYDRETEGLGYLPPTDDTERMQKAFEYFQKGAELGEAGCMNELGIMFMKGECTEADETEGFRWFKRAYQESFSDPGNRAEAAYHLAVCYHYGNGIGKNLKLALRYANEARNLDVQEYKNGHTGSRYFVDRDTGEIQKILSELDSRRQIRNVICAIKGLMKNRT